MMKLSGDLGLTTIQIQDEFGLPRISRLSQLMRFWAVSRVCRQNLSMQIAPIEVIGELAVAWMNFFSILLIFCHVTPSDVLIVLDWLTRMGTECQSSRLQ